MSAAGAGGRSNTRTAVRFVFLSLAVKTFRLNHTYAVDPSGLTETCFTLNRHQVPEAECQHATRAT